MKCVLLYKKYGDEILDVIKELINAKPYLINKNNHDRYTALMIASVNSGEYSNIKIVKLLLNHKNCMTHIVNRYSKTALYETIIKYNEGYSITVDTILLLIKHTENISSSIFHYVVRNKMNHIIVDALIKQNKTYLNETFQRSGGHTMLTYACHNNDLETVKVLVKHGVSIDKKNGKGDSVIMYCCFDDRQIILKYLIKNKGTINYVNNVGNSPLLMCIKNRYITGIKLLIEYGCDLNMHYFSNHKTTAISHLITDGIMTYEKKTIMRLLMRQNYLETINNRKRYKRSINNIAGPKFLKHFGYDKFISELRNTTLLQMCVIKIKRHRRMYDDSVLKNLNRDVRKLFYFIK